MSAVQRPRGNIPKSPLRWSVERAAAEFKLAPVTLRKILRQAGVEPDAGGCYSTETITRCVFGDLHSEKLRKERQLTKKYELENQIVEAEYLKRSEIAKSLAAVADAVVSRIMSASIPREVKEDVLKNIADIPLKLLENVTHAQTRFRRGRVNGQTDGT